MAIRRGPAKSTQTQRFSLSVDLRALRTNVESLGNPTGTASLGFHCELESIDRHCAVDVLGRKIRITSSMDRRSTAVAHRRHNGFGRVGDSLEPPWIRCGRERAHHVNDHHHAGGFPRAVHTFDDSSNQWFRQLQRAAGLSLPSVPDISMLTIRLATDSPARPPPSDHCAGPKRVTQMIALTGRTT